MTNLRNRKLDEYLSALHEAGILLAADVPADARAKTVNAVTYDSRTACAGALFIVKGEHFDPKYLAAAADAGAIAYVISESDAQKLCASDRDIAETTRGDVLADTALSGSQVSAGTVLRGDSAPAIVVSDIHQAIIILGQMFYNHATDELTAVGVTGTKGKSTVVYYLRSIMREWLRAQDKPGPAILSSIKNYDGGSEEESHLTTPEPLELYQHFSRAKAAGIDHMVMEVSSQALKYGRVDGMRFAVGAFLNIGADHISPIEHVDFEDYYTSKLRIFDDSDVVIVNADADYAERTLVYGRERTRVVTFGEKPECDVYCDPESVKKRGVGFEFDVVSSAYSGRFNIEMSGRFNVSNALAAIAIAGELGVPEKYVRQGLMLARVPGRVEVYASADSEVVAIVDYAHNKLSYEKLFESMKAEYPGYGVVAVFGSAGGKAFDRRVDLSETASRYSDFIYLTEEDNYFEPFNSIASDMLKHVSVPCIVNEDREQCIYDAVLRHTGKHLVVVLGKGVETTRARGGKYVEFPTDAEYARAALRAYDKRQCGDN